MLECAGFEFENVGFCSCFSNIWVSCPVHECEGNANPSEGDLCLFDKIDDHTGRLEVFRQGVWGTICTDDPHYPDLAVACRQMGYPAEGR